MAQKTFLSIGECMVELTEAGPGTLRKGFAGDTFNMAYYARHALPDDWQIEYLTALGIDAVSSEMLAFMTINRIGTRHVICDRDRLPGLYMVHVDKGERSFSYWRTASAARWLAADADRLRQAISAADQVFFSGITMAIVRPEDRPTLLTELARAKAQGREVVFDPNIRVRLWESIDEARSILTEAARASTIVMPSFDDENMCFGDKSPEETIARYRSLGIDHVVVKNGASGTTVFRHDTRWFVPAIPTANVVDTTSAGDSFNGTYLARLMHGDTPEQAARFAAKVASFVIGHQGAIVPHKLRPELSG